MMLLEFITMITEGARIDHPEDLIFSTERPGAPSAGAAQAITALKSVISNPGQITIKWDGFPALVFGRNRDGQLVVADKHMFTKKDGSGRVTSLEQFIQYDVNRGANRGDLYAKLKVLWPGLAAATEGTQGYYWGDLLWAGRPPLENGSYVFKPNTVTYAIDARSDLGKRIGTSTGGIVIHQYFEDFDTAAVPLNGNLAGLKTDGPVMMLTPEMPEKVNLREPVQQVRAAESALKKYGAEVDALLDPVTLVSIKSKDLGALLQKYMNARVRGVNARFSDWLQSQVSPTKFKTLVGEGNGYLFQHEAGVEGAFAIFEAITNLKLALIKQLDSQQGSIKSSINGVQGGEGYVFATPAGLIKLVDRSGFSAANFAKND